MKMHFRSYMYDLDTELDLYRMASGFHELFAVGVACQLGTRTLPDTWFRPFLGLDYAPICSNFSRICHVFFRFNTLNIPRTFSSLLCKVTESPRPDLLLL